MSDKTESKPSEEPKVKHTQEFKPGDTVIHRAEKTEHKVIKVTDRGVRCERLPGLMNPEMLARSPTENP